MEFEGDPNAAGKRPNPESAEAVMANSMEVQPTVVRPTKRRASNPAEANQRHIKTEQARRDKISAGFNALQELLPGRERVEKATLLTNAAAYIASLQGVLSTILTNGTIAKLPDELQWQIRSQLPAKVVAARLPQNMIAPPAPIPGVAALLNPGQAENGQQISGQAPSTSGAVNLPFMPLMTQANSGAGPLSGNKEIGKEEGELMAQVQAQIQQLQQQAAAAQQMQTWQQAFQALQLQQAVFSQQPGGQGPDLAALASAVSAAPPAAIAQVMKQAEEIPPGQEVSARPDGQPGPTTESFTELLAPVQQQARETGEPGAGELVASGTALTGQEAPGEGEPSSVAKSSAQGNTTQARKSKGRPRKSAAAAKVKTESPVD